jgi:UDP-2-acetamido-2,6-beta-L-arabino-hexul-4-ose reductase
MRILVTGATGFVGKNLCVRLREHDDFSVVAIDRSNFNAELSCAVARADVVVHLAGENRPTEESGFALGNVATTEALIAAVKRQDRPVPIIYASSRQAELDNPYGLSKRKAEQVLERFCVETRNPVAIYRLPGVFGKWCRPNYNSVVATFCNDIARGVEPTVFAGERELSLVYVDDVVDEFIMAIRMAPAGFSFRDVTPEYRITVSDLLQQIKTFQSCRRDLTLERVGSGLTRALYSTFISHIPKEAFSYSVPIYSDPRGSFVEMLKTKDSGQLSFFTAHPGVTRGGHYHHSKTEKFLVISGTARFRFRHILTDEVHEFDTSGRAPLVVDTIPGWAHDITNIGSDELVVMLWANEIFDRGRPDTVAARV